MVKKETAAQKKARLQREKEAKEKKDKKDKDDKMDIKKEDQDWNFDEFGNRIQDAAEGAGGGIGGSDRFENPWQDLREEQYDDEEDPDCYKECNKRATVDNYNCKQLKDAFVDAMKERGCKVTVSLKSSKKSCKGPKSKKKKCAKTNPQIYTYSAPPPPMMAAGCGCMR
jgi:hypothetical protein